MAWTLDNPQTDAEWFKEFAKIAVANPPTALPEQYRTIGRTEVIWFEAEPEVAVIQCKGGGPDERKLAEWIVREELGAAGYRQASFILDGSEDLRKTAAWPDIMAKAKRLIQSGNVRILRNGFNIIAAHVVGDHGEYNCDISRDDPSSRAITQWTCECPWDQYAWQRTRKWKKYEGRPCAHVLAAYWQSLATPLDDYDPNAHGPLPPGQKRPTPMQMQKAPTPPPEGPAGVPDAMGIPKDIFNQTPTQQQPIPVGQQPPSPGTLPQNIPPGVGQLPLFSQPPSQTAPFMAPPEDQGIIPPFPGAMQQETQQAITIPVSVPGGRPGPYPANPLQQQFTFSKMNDNSYWTMGNCWAYAQALRDLRPDLNIGMMYERFGDDINAAHAFMHDRNFAYDAAGKHPLPYDHPNPNVYTEYDVHPSDLEDRLDDMYAIDRPDATNHIQHTHPDLVRTAAAGDVFNNSDMVRLNEPLMGVMEGPKPNQFGDGQYREIPQNSIGEVLGQDQTTGWVDVIFPLHDTGPNEPYHVRAWIEPEKLTPMPGVKKPGPFIKRVGMTRYVYHAAPTAARESILRHGLNHARGAKMWPQASYPDANYFYHDYTDAYWQAMTHLYPESGFADKHGIGEVPMDVWKVRADNLRLSPDPQMPEAAAMSSDPVAPEHLELIPDWESTEGINPDDL